jgi:hypothetical protein
VRTKNPEANDIFAFFAGPRPLRRQYLGNGRSCNKTVAQALVELSDFFRKPFAEREYLVSLRRYLHKGVASQIEFSTKFHDPVKFVN